MGNFNRSGTVSNNQNTENSSKILQDIMRLAKKKFQFKRNVVYNSSADK